MADRFYAIIHCDFLTLLFYYVYTLHRADRTITFPSSLPQLFNTNLVFPDQHVEDPVQA